MNESEKEQEWFDAATRYLKSCMDFGFTNVMLYVPKQLKDRSYAEFRKQGFFVSDPFDHEELENAASFVMITQHEDEANRLVDQFDVAFQE